MKKRSKKLTALAVLALILFALCLSGCSKYKSKYKAVGFVHSNTSGSAFMTFYEFDGTMVFKLQNRKGMEGQVEYSAKLETGNAAVYYDLGGTKTELFSIREGEEVSSTLGLKGSGTVYMIVQTDGKCQNGEFRFDIK